MNYNKRFDPDTITNEELLTELTGLSKKLGRTPSQNDMRKYGNNITSRLYLYRRRFGSIQLAQESAGLSKNATGSELRYASKDLLDEIVRIQKQLSRTPTQDDLIQYGKYPPGAYKRHFGCYNNALKQLGIRHNIRFGQSTEDIKADIIRVSKFLGYAPSADEFTQHSNTVTWITAANKIDGYCSWNGTLKACGLAATNSHNLTERELKQEIMRLKDETGRVPGYFEMAQLGRYSPETYALRFGTYVKALKYFGFRYIPQNQWHNQIHTPGKDGQLYKSRFEALIADTLLKLKQSNKIVSYEYEKLVCTDRKWTCDFYVKLNNGELWLEADGMGNNRSNPYDDGNEKIEFYTNNNYRFLIVPYRKLDFVKYLENIIDPPLNICFSSVISPVSLQKAKPIMTQPQPRPHSNKQSWPDEDKMDLYLPTQATKWTGGIDFPQTNHITTKPNARADEVIVWKGNKLTNTLLRFKTPDERDEIAKDVFNYLLGCDFGSYRITPKKAQDDWENLKTYEAIIETVNGSTYLDNFSSVGGKVYRHFFPNLMKLKNGNKKSVFECLTDREILWKIVRNRVGNTLIYAERKGQTSRMYPMTLTALNMWIQGAKATGLASHGSQFKPGTAKAIYNRFVKDGDLVLDYSAGYGSRLLGLWATGKSAKYYAYEPCTETYDNLIKMRDHFGLFAEIKKCGSEDALFDERFDFVFSSPPFFNQEHYSKEGTQAANKYPDYDSFMEFYWRQTVRNIKVMMKPNATFGINAGSGSNDFMARLNNDFNRIIVEEGFALVDTWYMKTPRSHLTNKRASGDTIKPESICFYKVAQ